MTSTGKRKDRQSITIKIINKKENEHKSDTELARIYNLDRSTVSNIIRNKQKFSILLSKLEQGPASVLECKKVVLTLLKMLSTGGF